jgi:hypothetical protein
MMGGRAVQWTARTLVAAVVAVTLTACSSLPTTVASRPLSPIARGEVRRIAVLPFTTVALAPDRESELGAEPRSESPGETVTRAVATAMREQTQWVLVDDLTVGEAIRQVSGELRPPTADEARSIAKILRADAVLRGDVRVFEERIGTELAAKRPAHVVFAVELMRAPDGTALWQGEYAEQQKSLSENLWNLPGLVRAGGTWVRAGELAEIGASQLVTRLHTALYGAPPSRGAKKKSAK